ncbi:MAG: hypothetical protein K2M55_06670 [Muribaculaceae bacterium]|nr:hypothetical protein [Muribaculaceae bacterium]
MNKLGISIVRLLGILSGLALVGFSIIGMEIEQYDRTTVLFVAIAMVLVGALTWLYAVKCKQAYRNVKTARALEIFSLLILLATLGATILFAPAGMSVVAHSGELRAAARADYNDIAAKVEAYRTDQLNNRINVTEQGLRAYLAANPENVSDELLYYIRLKVQHGSTAPLSRQTLDRFIEDSKMLAQQGSMNMDTLTLLVYEAERAAAHVDGISYEHYADIPAWFSSIESKLCHVTHLANFDLDMRSITNNNPDGMYTCRHIASGEYFLNESHLAEFPALAGTKTKFYAALEQASTPGYGEGAVWLALVLLVLLDYLLCRRTVAPRAKGPRISDEYGKPL